MESVNGCDLEGLMRTYGNDVLRTAYLYVKDKQTAEDIFQDVFIKVNQNLHSFRGDASIKTWIMRITINACKDFLKSAYQRHTVVMDEFVEDNITSEEDYSRLERLETMETVKQAVMELPQNYREVIICVYYSELSMEQTAKQLHVPVGTVKSRLARAKDKLKEFMERRHLDETVRG